jgi:hypothetical protein
MKTEVSMKRRKMVNGLLLAFLAFALVATGFSKDKPVDSQWASAPASIDGMNTEWGNVSLVTHKKTKVDYAFMNGAEDLFILFIFKDPKYLSSLSWTGLTVWLSPQGEKDKNLGIRFIKKQISADDYIAILEKQVGKAMPEDKKEQIRQNKAYWLFEQELINKKAADYAEDAPKPKFTGALFRSNVLQKTVLYELAISFAKLAEIAPEIGAGPGTGLNVNFEWGGATKEYKEALASGMAQRDTSARAGGATGSLTSERGAGEGLGDVERSSSKLARMRSQLQRVKKYDFWVEVNLAQDK